MISANGVIIVAIVLYMAIIICIGAKYSKKSKTIDDFYLGGRKLGPFVTAMSAEASDMSSWLLMGLPGVALAGSIAEASWTAIGLAVGTYINWLIVAKRLRVYTEKTNSITIPDFFSNRYRDDKCILMAISAIIIAVFFIPYTASGFAACGKLFSTLFGWDYFWAMLISAIIIIIYTTLGGFLAASTTDFLQSIIMTIALIVVLVFGISNAGGISSVVSNAKSLEGYFSLTSFNMWGGDGIGSYDALTIASTLAWGLGYFGMPHILLRFMAIKDKQKITLSRRIASVWVVISMFIAIAIGVIGYSLVKNGVVTGLEDSERIIVAIAKIISQYGVFFAFVAGIIISGILASTMSTADSQLLAASSSISQNIFKGIIAKNISDKKIMVISRISLIVISVIAIFIAANPNSSVFRVVSFAWAGFGASFGPVVLFALFWKRSNKWGALAGMVVGGAMVFIWKYLVAPLGGIFAIYELLPAFICASIAIVVVSLLTPAPEKEIVEEFKTISSNI
ncbi:MAG: sodium/proline symporter PutP [Clostridia bacterium]|nr:sodium/proline symporter PutP [Clostridia bacterium]